MRHGIGVSGITLWMFGGVARLEKDSDTPARNSRSRSRGPLVTAAIVPRLAPASGCCWRAAMSSENAALAQNDTSDLRGSRP